MANINTQNAFGAEHRLQTIAGIGNTFVSQHAPGHHFTEPLSVWDRVEDNMKIVVLCYVRVIQVLAQICVSTEVVDLAFVKEQAKEGLYTWSTGPVTQA